VSLPRDSYVPIPGYGHNKLNAAFAFGGPELLVQTVEQVTGLRIDHYRWLLALGVRWLYRFGELSREVPLADKLKESAARNDIIQTQQKAYQECVRRRASLRLRETRTASQPTQSFDRARVRTGLL